MSTYAENVSFISPEAAAIGGRMATRIPSLPEDEGRFSDGEIGCQGKRHCPGVEIEDFDGGGCRAPVEVGFPDVFGHAVVDDDFVADSHRWWG